MDGRHPATGEAQDNSEQGLSDTGQTVADGEQTLADSDQTLSDRDQRASEDDQAASDLDADLLGNRGAGSRASTIRAEATREREVVSALRDVTGDHRDLSAKRRDELSSLRDEIARQRDEESAQIDATDEVSDRHTLRVDQLRARARAARIRAASDRERAARDRAQAAHDREQAALDRERAGTDELTGARRRGVGLEELENEIKRARREDTSLVLAYVDVDGLKAVNDTHGHAAGDEVLRNVARGLRRHMRSYDLMVRMGGDEFLCALPEVSATEAGARFGDLRQDLNGSTGNSVSIGFSELRESDSADALVQRADSDLLSRRGHPPRPPPSS